MAKNTGFLLNDINFPFVNKKSIIFLIQMVELKRSKVSQCFSHNSRILKALKKVSLFEKKFTVIHLQQNLDRT